MSAVQLFYCLPNGQYYGSWLGKPGVDNNPFVESEYLEVPCAPESTRYFWDIEKQAFYLPDSPDVEREWRDSELADLVWLRDRHRDQLEIGVEPTLDTQTFNELLLYLQQLRDWPQKSEFPTASARPVAPVFLEQLRSVL